MLVTETSLGNMKALSQGGHLRRGQGDSAAEGLAVQARSPEFNGVCLQESQHWRDAGRSSSGTCWPANQAKLVSSTVTGD